jgi:hypothetical protein
MTRDQRIDALTQSVELLASFHKDNQQMIVSVAENLSRLEDLVERIGDATERLIGGMNNHEVRIRQLEGR